MALQKFIIERDIPKVGTFEREQLRAAGLPSGAVGQVRERHPVDDCRYRPRHHRSGNL
jgi:hypothetical protein